LIRLKDHGVLEALKHDSITSHHFEHDQYQTFDKLISFHFNKIELEHECDLNPQLCDSVSNFESMLTHVSLPDLDHTPKQH